MPFCCSFAGNVDTRSFQEVRGFSPVAHVDGDVISCKHTNINFLRKVILRVCARHAGWDTGKINEENEKPDNIFPDLDVESVYKLCLLLFYCTQKNIGQLLRNLITNVWCR